MTRFGAPVTRPHRALLLGSSAALDLLVQLSDEAVLPALSLLGSYLASPVLGTVTTWGVFAVSLFTFGHLAYSFHGSLPADAPGFLAIYTAVTVGLGYALATDYSIAVTGTVWILGTVLGGVALLGYLRTRRGWALVSPTGRLFAVVTDLFPNEAEGAVDAELRADLQSGGVTGRIRTGTFLLAAAVVLAFPTMLSAVVLQVLLYASPLPDVLFLGWAVTAVTLPRISVGPDRGRVVELDFELERYLVDAVENATRSVMGMCRTLYVGFGLLSAAAFFFATIAFLPVVATVYGTVVAAPSLLGSTEVLLLLWRWTGVLLLCFVAGAHGFWSWLRELNRLPHFLDAWEGRTTRRETAPLPRVRGFVLVPVLAWLTGIAGVHVDQLFENGVTVYALVWPVPVVLAWESVRQTLGERDGSVSGSGLSLFAGAIGQVVTFVFGTRLLVDAGTSAPMAFVVELLTLVTLLAAVAALPYVFAFERDRGKRGLARYAAVGLLLVLGGVAALWATTTAPEYRLLGRVLSAICLISAALLSLVRWLDV